MNESPVSRAEQLRIEAAVIEITQQRLLLEMVGKRIEADRIEREEAARRRDLKAAKEHLGPRVQERVA